MATAVTSDNELLELFTRDDQDLWPEHVVACAVGVATVALRLMRRDERVTAGLLAVLARDRHRRRGGLAAEPSLETPGHHLDESRVRT